MQPIIDLSFPHNYQIETDCDWTEDCKRYYYPGAQESGKDGLSVVISVGKEKWMGVFEFAYPKAHSGIYSMPNSDHLAVVSAGLGTVVDCKNPKNYSKIDVFPIMKAIAHNDQKKLIFASFTNIAVYSAIGLDWEVRNISCDGIDIESANNTGISVLTWNSPANCYELFYLDLISRECTKVRSGIKNKTSHEISASGWDQA